MNYDNDKLKTKKTKVIPLRFSEGLHTEMKIYVAKNKTSIQQLILKLIQRELNEQI